MAVLDRQVNFIKKQLLGLETSQRIAIGLCAVVVAGSIMWLAQWSLQREMVPLVMETMSEEELANVIQRLSAMGEEFQERGNSVYVRPQDRRRLVMMLVENNAGPSSLSITFSELIKNSSNFASEKKTQWQQKIALQNELAMTIKASRQFRDASVFIAEENRPRMLGPAQSKPKATVNVTLARDVRMDKGVVTCLADLVSGAVAGLDPENVRVVDQTTMRSYSVDGQEEAISTRLYDLQREKEKQLQAKIEEILGHIPGVVAMVSIKMDEEASSIHKTELEKPEPISEETEEDETSNLARGTEPGVSANTSIALSGGGAGSNRTQAKSRVEYSENRGGTITETVKKPGKILEAAASISLPRSYFVGVAKLESPNAEAEPTNEDVDEIIERERSNIEELVKPILQAEEEPVVQVYVNADQAWAHVPPSPAESEPESATMVDMLKSNVKPIGLAGLALMALGMMFQIVRKGGRALPDPAQFSTTTSEEYADLTVDGGPIGKAGEPGAFLIAQETDEGAIRTRQISDQVTELINDDPEGAAQLVRRWIEREP